jgi:hypothetical protein
MAWLHLFTAIMLAALFARSYRDPTSPPRLRLRRDLAAGSGGRVLAWLSITGVVSILLGSMVIALQGAFNIASMPWWLTVTLAGLGVAAFVLYVLLRPFLMQQPTSR